MIVPETREEKQAKCLPFPCPTCKAKPGEPCDYRGSQHKIGVHTARQDRFIRAQFDR